MILLILSSCLLLASAAPKPGFDYSHSYIDDHSYGYSSSYVSAPIIKTISAAPVYKTYSEPIYISAPIIKSAPIYKTFAPASSYATVASYKIAHAPIVKVISSPIIKSYSSW